MTREASERQPQALVTTEGWDRYWSEARAGRDYADLRWVRGDYLCCSLDGLLRSVLPADPTRSFIELGAGGGRWLVYFHRVFGYRVTGCDLSRPSCERARQTLARAGIAATVREASFFDVEGQYDVVFSAGVIEHFADPTAPLAAFARLVAPGGFLVTSVPNLTGLNGLYRRLLKPETFATHTVIRLTALRRWHRDLGFHERLATPYGSLCLNRLPLHAFPGFPRLQRRVWRPAYRLASGGVNQACLALHRLGVRIDHPWISPHFLVVAVRPAA